VAGWRKGVRVFDVFACIIAPGLWPPDDGHALLMGSWVTHVSIE
jgi:hypothetical protein